MLLKKFITIFIFLVLSLQIAKERTYAAPQEEVIFQAERSLFYFDIKNKEFSEDLLKKCIYFERIKYPEVVLLQAQLETGFYTSDIFLNGHNCFGMKFPQYRQTISIGTYQEHAQYTHWTESIKDYKKWQDWYLNLGYKINTENDNNFYLVFLRCVRYAEDPKYIHKLVYLSQKDIT